VTVPTDKQAAPDWIRARVVERAGELDLTAYALAKMTEGKVSKDTVGRYLSGRGSISSDRLQHLLTALGLTVTVR
jgi:hypothetical protein